MSEKIKNKYRIASHRKPGWNYSSNGMYFITIVRQNHVCNLGDVIRSYNNRIDQATNDDVSMDGVSMDGE